MRIVYQQLFFQIFISFVIFITSLAVAAQNSFPQPIRMNAADDINLEGAFVDAGDLLHVTAGNNINLLTGISSSNTGSKHKEGFIGLEFADGGQINSEHYQSVKDSLSTTTSIGSSLNAAGSAIFNAGQDMNIIGSSIVANDELSIDAGRDINLLTGTSTRHQNHEEEEIIVGIDFSSSGNSAEVFAGMQTTRSGEESSQSNASGQFAGGGGNYGGAGSSLSGNNISLSAGENILVVGSDLIAMPTAGILPGLPPQGGNLSLDAGNDITTLASVNDDSLSTYEESLRVGIRLGVQENVSSAVESVETAQDEGGAANTLRAVDAVSGLSGGAASVSVGYIMEWEKTESEDENSTTRSTQLLGNNITLNSGGDQTHQGTEAHATNALDIDAGGDLNITSAEDNQTHKDKSQNASAEVGLGTSGGINLSGALGYSNNRDNSVTHNNAHLSGNNVTITTGNDAIIKGGVISGNNVTADIGGDLSIESQQDTSHVRGESGSISASTSGNFGLGYGNSKGDKDWVSEQSGILATNTADIYVENHTALTGGVINSESGDLTLDTQSLSHSDIHDRDKLSSVNVSVGFSVGQGESANTENGTAPSTAPINEGKEGESGNNSLGIGYSNTDREQITRATIGQGDIIIRDGDSTDINRDIDKAQEITKDEDDSVDFYVSTKSLDTISDTDKLADTLNPITTVGDIAASTAEGIDELDNALSDALTLNGLSGDADTGTRGLLDDDAVAGTAQGIRDGADGVSAAIINHIEAAVTNLPEQYQEVGDSMNATFKDYIKQGGDPDTYVELLQDESFLDLASKLSEVQQAIKALEKEGFTQEQIANFLSSSTSSGDGTIKYLNGDEQAMDIHGTTVGIDTFQAISELTTETKALLKDVPLEQLGHAQLAIGVLISGPTRVAIEVAKEMGVEHLIGEHVKTASEAVSIRLAALSHGIPDEQVIQMVNIVEDPAALEAKLASGEITQEEANTYISVADSVEATHHGAGSATEATLMALLGIATAKVGIDIPSGGGKGNSNGGSNPRENHSNNSSGTEVSSTFKDPDSGVDAINPVRTRNNSEIDRLAQDSATGKRVEHEARAAVEMQNTLGGKLERVIDIDGKQADYFFTSGPHKGKTVDFMWTDSKKAPQINKFFKKNYDQNHKQLINHIKKSDIVPLDYRNLNASNQSLVNKWIKKLSLADQAKILIIR